MDACISFAIMINLLHTNNLYKYDEVISALQKSIRRGLVTDALFWAGELENSHYGNAMYNRLFTIMAEDISIAEPALCLNLYDLYRQWLIERKKKADDNAKLISMKAIIMLTQADKNRVVNHGLLYVTSFVTPPFPPQFNIKPATHSLIDQLIPPSLFKDNNTLDLRAALIQFAAALEQKNELNALFFGNFINMEWHCEDNRRLLERYLQTQIVNSSKKLGRNASLYSWYLMLSLAKPVLYDIIKTLYFLYIKDLGATRLNLALAIVLFVRFQEIDFTTISIPRDFEVTQAYKEIYFNEFADILSRRQLAVPDYALDKHTSRGKGSQRQQNNIHLLHQQAAIDSLGWTVPEIQKSHGDYKNFAAHYDETCHSRMSHFFDVAAVTTKHKTGMQGIDNYRDKARKYYLAIEKKYGYRQAKSTKIEAKIYPQLLQNQNLWQINGTTL
jgi:hypothetical protein